MATTINPSDQTITQYNVQTGAASNLLNNVAPSATSGVPLISQGSSAQPIFGTTVVAGGGTGDTSFTAYSVITGGTTSTGALQQVSGVGTAGQLLQSQGASSLPVWANTFAGSTTGSAPAAGYIGERLIAEQGSSQSLTNNTLLNLASLTLTAGVWNISGYTNFSGITTGTFVYGGLSTVNNAFTNIENQGCSFTFPISSLTNAGIGIVTLNQYVSISISTTYYVNAKAGFTVGSGKATGSIVATRVG